MRLSVFELLEENEKLPESEKIDRHEFELVNILGWYKDGGTKRLKKLHLK